MSNDLPRLLPRLVDRVDNVEAKVTGHDATLTEHGERLDDAEARIDRLEHAARARRPVDWLSLTDPTETIEILRGAIGWHDRHCGWLNATIRYPCWPWHPLAVIEVLALRDIHTYAYMAGPPAVADFLSLRLPGFRTRVNASDGPVRGCCKGGEAGVHYLPGDDDTPYLADPAFLADYAAWWATSRQGLPPGLTPIPAAVNVA